MSRKKLFLNSTKAETIEEVWELYSISQKAEGVSDVTLRNYKQHLHSISKYLNIKMSISILTKKHLDKMIADTDVLFSACEKATKPEVILEQPKGALYLDRPALTQIDTVV